MILPEEFNEKWDVNKDGPLIKFNSKELSSANFTDKVKSFLSIGGLPETPPPHLEFISSKALLRPVTIVLNKPEVFQNYWFLGSTGSGDPICIVERTENIVFLNNTDNYNEVFINSSINQFAECLLAYSKMIDKAIEINGEDAYIDNEIPNSVINWLKGELERIDANCINQNYFWFIEIENLIE